jgi:hypothetical protein
VTSTLLSVVIRVYAKAYATDKLVLRYLVWIGIMRRLALRRLLRAGMRGRRVRLTGHSRMSLVRFSRVGTMAGHRIVSFGKLAEEQQREKNGHASNQVQHLPRRQFGGRGKSL